MSSWRGYWQNLAADRASMRGVVPDLGMDGGEGRNMSAIGAGETGRGLAGGGRSFPRGEK